MTKRFATGNCSTAVTRVKAIKVLTAKKGRQSKKGKIRNLSELICTRDRHALDPELFIQISLLEFRAKNEPLSIDYPGWFYPSSDLEEVFDFSRKKEWSTVEFKSNFKQI